MNAKVKNDPALEVVRVLQDDGSLDASRDPGLTPDEVRFLYRHMVRTRLIDERLVTLQRQGRIGFHIGSLGEEAAILGSTWALAEIDWVFPCYREFGAALMRGFPLSSFLDNMYGNADDPVKGRQMPDHYTCRAVRWGSVSSPIGTQMTQAVGFSWAARLRHDPAISLVYFGDGSTSSNEFHNAMNFAGVFRTPTVLFCRNNGWAISVPVERQTASDTFAEKGIAYGVPGVRVDGNDLWAVVKVTREAAALARSGGGPTLIEALTYRMGGHSTSDDPNRYREKKELEPWIDRDPIERTRRWLDRSGHWSNEEEEHLRAEVDAEVRAAIGAAEKKPPPALSTLFDDVYESLPWHLVEQREQLLRGPRAPAAHG